MERRITYRIKKSLITAIDENRLDIIRSVLANYKKRKRFTSANDTIRMQENPIHYAARYGKLDALRIVIQSNLFQIDEKNTNGETPLCIACDVGYVDIARELIINKAQINFENEKFKTPLILATELVSPYDMDMVKLLVENGAVVNQITRNENSALLSAAKFGNLELVKYLIEFYKAKVNHKFHDGATPLMRACYYGYPNLVKYLLDKGAVLEERNNRRETPLYIASFRGYESIVEILIERGANVNSEDNDGDTPLTVACYENKANIIPLLLNNHAVVNQKGIRGDTPIHIAVSNCSITEVRDLINRGAYVNVLNHDNETPLHIAARQSRVEIINELLDKSLMINTQSLIGHTPFRSVIEYLSIAKIDAAIQMIRMGCDVNIKITRDIVTGQIGDNLLYSTVRHTCLEHIFYFYDHNLIKSEHDKQKLIKLIDMILKAGYKLNKVKDLSRVMTTNLLNNYPMVRKYLLIKFSSPDTLANLCRVKVRNLLVKPLAISINLLNVPKFVKEFLYFL